MGSLPAPEVSGAAGLVGSAFDGRSVVVVDVVNDVSAGGLSMLDFVLP